MDIEKELASALQSDLISKKSLLGKLDPLYKQKRIIVPDNLAEGFVQVESLIKWEPSAFKGMTNGEAFCSVFDVMVLTIIGGKVWVEKIYFPFDEEWWNAPYEVENGDEEDT